MLFLLSPENGRGKNRVGTMIDTLGKRFAYRFLVDRRQRRRFPEYFAICWSVYFFFFFLFFHRCGMKFLRFSFSFFLFIDVRKIYTHEEKWRRNFGDFQGRMLLTRFIPVRNKGNSVLTSYYNFTLNYHSCLITNCVVRVKS